MDDGAENHNHHQNHQQLVPLPSSRPSYASLPIREDCWSEEATSTLIDAWGERHLELNRGNLRQKHWQEVADAVNSRHGTTKKSRRTDIQCKNRIDTLKKKYKIEKAKIVASGGTLTSQWPFYPRLDMLVGTSMPPKKSSSSSSHFHHHHHPRQHQHQQQEQPLIGVPLSFRKMQPLLPHTAAVPTPPTAPRSVREKRPPDESFFRRNYSAVAAAAAAATTDSGSSRSSTESSRRRERERETETEREREREREKEGEVDGVKELAQAIAKFGEVYEKVEGVKQRQIVELEKQRMEFMKSLEYQRMQLFMDWQVRLEKIKRSKRSGASDAYS